MDKDLLLDRARRSTLDFVYLLTALEELEGRPGVIVSTLYPMVASKSDLHGRNATSTGNVSELIDVHLMTRTGNTLHESPFSLFFSFPLSQGWIYLGKLDAGMLGRKLLDEGGNHTAGTTAMDEIQPRIQRNQVENLPPRGKKVDNNEFLVAIRHELLEFGRACNRFNGHRVEGLIRKKGYLRYY